MFLAPLFLFGLLAIGVPIWLHRVARANPTQHPFGSLMFIEASETQRTAKRTLRYWLLLSLRILLLIALVLAFAGPLLTERVLPVGNANARLHAIVLDKSLSMQHGERWQRALDEAEAVLKDLRSSDRVMLATAEGRRVSVMQSSTPASAAGTVRGTLRALKPGIERLDYGLAMSTADNWLGSPRPPVVLHLISDLQQSAAPLRFADLEPPTQTQLVLHDVGNAAAENVFIQGAQLTTVDTRSLEVTVRGASAKPQQRQVVLAIDGKEYARRTVELPAGAVTVADPTVEGEGGHLAPEFAPQAAASPVREGAVLRPEAFCGLAPDGSCAGAGRRLAAGRSLLCRAGARRSESAAGRDRCAQLTTSRTSRAAIGSLAAPTLRIEERAPETIGTGALTGFSLLVVADTAALSDIQAKRIKEYVAAGGSVLATLGTRTAIEPGPLLEGWRISEPEQRALQWARSRRRIRSCARRAIGILCASSDIAQSRSAMTTKC